jgi:tRNA-modifying protein YgfZ
VAGPDAVSYLQGQVSQDVDALTVGHSAWSFVLQPTGKVGAWVRLTRTGDDEVVLDVDGGHGSAVIAQLRRFLLRTKADIDPLVWRVVALRGPGAEAAGAPDADAPSVGAPSAEGGQALAVPAGWPSVEGVDLLGADAAPPSGVPEASPDDYASLRIRSGVPRMGAELTEATIPAEAGQWLVDTSVSFTKGCFTGQELVARINSRGGNVPRRLRGLVVPGGEVPAEGAAVVADGREVGTVTSASSAPGAERAVALAYVGRGVTPPAAVEVRDRGRALAGTLVDLPME